MEENVLDILSLPNLVLLEILEYLPFDEVSKKRLVCRRFDQLCQQVLNSGFNKVIKQHGISLKRIKALLPRRESERRNHCLARHADILTSIETRISMLSMTYTKYMDLNLCCFIPGRVLDEIFRILRLISKSTKPLRPHVVLQELRDISSMAMEHFDEKIANSLKKTFTDTASSSKMCSSSNTLWRDNRRFASTSGLGNISFSGMDATTAAALATTSALPLYSGTGGSGYVFEPLTSNLSLINERLNGRSYRSSFLSEDTTVPSRTCYGDEHQTVAGEDARVEGCSSMVYFKKLEADHKKSVAKMHRMQQVQYVQHRRLQQALSSLADLNGQIVELKKRLEDVDAKNREMSANIRHINGGSSPDTASAATLCSSPPRVKVPPRCSSPLDLEATSLCKSLSSPGAAQLFHSPPSPEEAPICSSPSSSSGNDSCIVLPLPISNEASSSSSDKESPEKRIYKRHIDDADTAMSLPDSDNLKSSPDCCSVKKTKYNV